LSSFRTFADAKPKDSADSGRSYSVYGVRIRSGIPLTIPETSLEGPPEIGFAPGEPEAFADALGQVHLNPSHWFHSHELPNRWSYIRFDALFEFLIAPEGNRILCQLLGPVSTESLQTYLLGRVFSHVLVKSGEEPLHASAVVVDGQGIAFLGASTFGKSSMASCFVAGGYRLLTDDVLRLKEVRDQLLAYPGPARLKLFPKIAYRFLGEDARGQRINPKSAKLVFPLQPEQSCDSPVPLAAIYVVTPSRKVHRRQSPKVHGLPPRDAILDLLSYSHNDSVLNSDRLARQFLAAKLVVDKVPVRGLAYPRIMESLPEVRDAILSDLQRRTEW